MRKVIFAAIAASAISGALAGSLVQLASAEQSPPAAPVSEGQFTGPRPGMMGRELMLEHRGWMHQMHGMMPGMMGRFMGHGPFTLFYEAADRQLSAADVQKIAEAILLRHGNHTWKVTDVSEGPENSVGFAYAAPDGTLIARFTMDRRTGRIIRVG